MPPDERDAAYLQDMLEAAQKVCSYVKGKTLRHYTDSALLRDAVERNVEIIGEAARKVSSSLKSVHPEIPWRQMIALRNVLVHEYGVVKNEEMWEVATVHLPALVQALTPLIPPLQ